MHFLSYIIVALQRVVSLSSCYFQQKPSSQKGWGSSGYVKPLLSTTVILYGTCAGTRLQLLCIQSMYFTSTYYNPTTNTSLLLRSRQHLLHTGVWFLFQLEMSTTPAVLGNEWRHLHRSVFYHSIVVCQSQSVRLRTLTDSSDLTSLSHIVEQLHVSKTLKKEVMV